MARLWPPSADLTPSRIRARVPNTRAHTTRVRMSAVLPRQEVRGIVVSGRGYAAWATHRPAGAEIRKEGLAMLERFRDLRHKAEELPAYVHGMEGYAYGFPLVIMDLTKGVLTAAGSRASTALPSISSPGSALCWLTRISRMSCGSAAALSGRHGFVDLEDEPFIYSQPDTKGRFIVMQALNMWTDDFASSGSRTTGTGRSLLIAGPDWDGTLLRTSRQTFRSTTRYAWILVQIAADGPARVR